MSFEGKKVWATLITTIDYLPGLINLDYSLKRVRSEYPLLVLYTSNFPEKGLQELQSRGIMKQQVKYLHPENNKLYLKDPRFNDCWTKLEAYGLFQFDRVVLLDSDMVVIKNMDELFDFELNGNAFAASWACVCNPRKFEHYPKNWKPQNCTFGNWDAKLSLKDDKNKIFGPQVHEKNGLTMCNSGLMVFEPSKQKYTRILDKLKDESLNYTFPDQQLVSDLFRGNWLGLSYGYNYLKTLSLIHKQLSFENVKNIHYILTPKPWEVDRSFTDDTGMFKYWWDINEERLAYEKK